MLLGNEGQGSSPPPPHLPSAIEASAQRCGWDPGISSPDMGLDVPQAPSPRTGGPPSGSGITGIRPGSQNPQDCVHFIFQKVTVVTCPPLPVLAITCLGMHVEAGYARTLARGSRVLFSPVSPGPEPVGVGWALMAWVLILSHPSRLEEARTGRKMWPPPESSLAESRQGAPGGWRPEGRGLQGDRMFRGLPSLCPVGWLAFWGTRWCECNQRAADSRVRQAVP